MDGANNQVPNDRSTGNGDYHEHAEYLLDLIQVAMETNAAFKIFPPKEVLNDLSCIRADDVIERLINTKWRLEFHDGTERVVSFTDLIVLLYNLRWIRFQIEESEQRCRETGERGTYSVDTTFDEAVIMRLDVVKELLGKVAGRG